jgi:hypothetical protein
MNKRNSVLFHEKSGVVAINKELAQLKLVAAQLAIWQQLFTVRLNRRSQVPLGDKRWSHFDLEEGLIPIHTVAECFLVLQYRTEQFSAVTNSNQSVRENGARFKFSLVNRSNAKALSRCGGKTTAADC